MVATLILGGGPAGTGPLIWAAQAGRLEQWLAAGITVVDRSDAMGGTLGRYAVKSDSLGMSYLECLDGPVIDGFLAMLRDDEATRALEAMRGGFPPLSLVGRFLRRLGAQVQQLLTWHPRGSFLPETEARALHVLPDGSLVAELSQSDGTTATVAAESVIMALGGRPNVGAWRQVGLIADGGPTAADPDKIIASDALLTPAGLAQAARRLEQAPTRRVVILGGSHSAFSAAWALLNLVPEIEFGAGDITILHRRPPRIFYPSPAEAEADGYAFGRDDICPVTSRVNRSGGLRGDGRELWRRLAGRPGTKPEPRVETVLLSDAAFSTAALESTFAEAALIVPAFGYRAATVPVFDADGDRLPLAAEADAPAVDREARVLLQGGGRLANVFAIGLGTGYRPWGRMGGEPSFTGQQNSLWLYQHDIGAAICEGISRCLDARLCAT